MPAGPRRPARAVPAAAAARRLGGAAQVAITSHAYEEVAKKFAKLLGMDPWLINPMFARCGEVNFQRRRRATSASQQRRRAARQDPPQVQGIRHPGEAVRHRQGRRRHLRHGHHDGARRRRTCADLNRKQRNKMSVVKDGQEVSEVIVQEGVPTYERDQRRGRRAGRLHDRPLRRRRLLPRARRARQRREPQRAGRAASCRSPSPRSTSCPSRARSRAPARRTASTCTA